ncbi:MAG: hypothetical protein KC547_21350, partial [Anaerolineae bacterium]|nr:hypothetical protein [Anaerolineae bacterium]
MMRYHDFLRYMSIPCVLVGLWILLTTVFVRAQDALPAPQFLFRRDDRLILLDGYTGETSELPFTVTALDRFTWSPDGRYLLAQLYEDRGVSCLNLYDVDTFTWVYEQPVSCDAVESIFYPDGTHLVYSTSDGINATLWLFDLADATSQQLYITPTGSELHRSGIDQLTWSPTESYLTFIDYNKIGGGTDNSLIVMNATHHTYITVSAPNTYYAGYYPVWSVDDRWFLVTLQYQYVTSGGFPQTNHQGDLYVVNTESGDSVRLTYTPTVREQDAHWTDDGGIAYSVFIEQKTTLTLEEALDTPQVPESEIVTPEPIDVQELFDPLASKMISPDPNISAWVNHDGDGQQYLNIGATSAYYGDTRIPIDDPT